jgi:hypothetical protein
MRLEELAKQVVQVVEDAGVPFMLVGALAAGAYGLPRSTRDMDFLVAVHEHGGVEKVIEALAGVVAFDPQIHFDSLTWGRPHVGRSKTNPPYTVELFELYDDPFVMEEFSRRRRLLVPLVGRPTWIPTVEDIIVQKLRWGRSKDLDDVRDVLAVQGIGGIDMDYVNRWTAQHGTQGRLEGILGSLPPD